MAWLYLALAGVFEIGFAISLKHSENFTKKPYVLSFALCALGSFGLLAKALETLPIGTAYAVWTGIGASGTIIYGIFFMKESTSPMRLLFLSMLLIALVGLRLTTVSK